MKKIKRHRKNRTADMWLAIDPLIALGVAWIGAFTTISFMHRPTGGSPVGAAPD
jgi:hypothetical protein